jgi:hypothetical protein
MKLIAQDGREIFDFGNDALGCAAIWKLAVLAKFQSGLDSTVTLNPLINDMMRAVGAAQPPHRTIHGTSKPTAMPEMTDHQIATSPELSAAGKLLRDELARLQWWELSGTDKLKHVCTVVYPFRLSTQQQADWVEELDAFVQQFRDPN